MRILIWSYWSFTEVLLSYCVVWMKYLISRDFSGVPEGWIERRIIPYVSAFLLSVLVRVYVYEYVVCVCVCAHAHMCMHACAHTRVCVCVCVCTCVLTYAGESGGPRLTPDIFNSGFSIFCFWDTVSHWTWKSPFWLVWLVLMFVQKYLALWAFSPILSLFRTIETSLKYLPSVLRLGLDSQQARTSVCFWEHGVICSFVNVLHTVITIPKLKHNQIKLQFLKKCVSRLMKVLT